MPRSAPPSLTLVPPPEDDVSPSTSPPDHGLVAAPGMTELPDDELAALIAAHENQAAFAVLVKRYERPLYGMVWRCVKNEATAADITQEIFLRAWKGLRKNQYQPRDGASFKSWLFQIGRRTVLDLLPRRGERPLDEAPEPSTEASPHPGSRNSQAVRPDASDRWAVVREATSRLPLDQRTVIEMEVDEFTQEQIAERMGVNRRKVVYLKEKALKAILEFCTKHLGKDN